MRVLDPALLVSSTDVLARFFLCLALALSVTLIAAGTTYGCYSGPNMLYLRSRLLASDYGEELLRGVSTPYEFSKNYRQRDDLLYSVSPCCFLAGTRGRVLSPFDCGLLDVAFEGEFSTVLSDDIDYVHHEFSGPHSTLACDIPRPTVRTFLRSDSMVSLLPMLRHQLVRLGVCGIHRFFLFDVWVDCLDNLVDGPRFEVTLAGFDGLPTLSQIFTWSQDSLSGYALSIQDGIVLASNLVLSFLVSGVLSRLGVSQTLSLGASWGMVLDPWYIPHLVLHYASGLSPAYLYILHVVNFMPLSYWLLASIALAGTFGVFAF